MVKAVYLKVEKLIDHPLEKVWETVALGFGNVSDYNPEIEHSFFESVKRSGVGVARHCDVKGGGFLKEEIIEWKDRCFFKLQLTNSSFPMAGIESKFTFTPLGHQTKLCQEFWYRMKPPMGWLSPIMRSRMRKTLENGLNGLEYYLTTQKKKSNGSK